MIDQIKGDEGFRGYPYKCSAGKLTIGYGRNLDSKPLTIDEAEYLLKNDLNDVLKQAVKLPYYSVLSPVRQSAVINMIFNLGITKYKKFIKMNDALNKGDYELSAIEMLDSEWAKQVGKRADRLALQMRQG
jgi:lysozyme